MELAKVIAQITAELRKARDEAAKHQDTIMQFEECEIELAVKFSAQGEGEIKVEVLPVPWGPSATVTGELQRETNHTIRLKFKPIPGEEAAYLAEEVENED